MDNNNKNKVILSGITPSGTLTIGHLAGALKNWVAMQEQFNCYYMVADMHAITVRQDPKILHQRTLEIAALFLACGIDPEKSVVFIQSHIPEHSQLTWVLSSITGFGELNRMTQFKDKSEKYPENINAGLFIYPVLMAADILLYKADAVPVGEDQKQHLELTRNIAQRFNNLFSDTFPIPEPYIPKFGSRIMNLQDPTKKMSKSDENSSGTIYLTDNDKAIRTKIKRAVTDSGSEIYFDEEKKAGISNLLTLYHIATNKPIEDIQKQFANSRYGEFKEEVANAVAAYISPIREKYEEIIGDSERLKYILKSGEEHARTIAHQTLNEIYEKIGFVQF
ncbi:MAG: tryptophan--tRNA ligase [Chloroherpetonaceae bacterium]|nr:tryptophan--tRNA ligase [bacterium]